MEESIEGLREAAETLSEAEGRPTVPDWSRVHPAWRRVAVRAEETYGAADHRTHAAKSRRARFLLLSGGGMTHVSEVASEAMAAVEAFARGFSESGGMHADEILYASETLALGQLALGEAAKARETLAFLLNGFSRTLGRRHPMTISARGAYRMADVVAERKARDFAAAAGAGDRLYRPVWVFAPMSEKAEGLRLAAEGISDAEPEKALIAWSAVADEAKREFGSGDPRRLAALSRQVRQELRGRREFLSWDRGKVDEFLELSRKALAGNTAEVLYAQETAGLVAIAIGEGMLAKMIIDLDVLDASRRELGLDHPQTLSALRSSALADLAVYEKFRSLRDRAMSDGMAARDRGKASKEAVEGARLMDEVSLTQARTARDLEKVSRRQAAALGREHPERLATEGALAETLQASGDRAATRETYVEYIKLLESSLPPSDPEVLKARYALAGLLAEDGEFAEAQVLLDKQLAVLTEAKGGRHIETLDALERLSDVASAQGKPNARLGLALVMAGRERALAEMIPDTLWALRALSSLHAAAGDGEAERGQRSRAAGPLEWKFGPDSLEAFDARAFLDEAWLIAGGLLRVREKLREMGVEPMEAREIARGIEGEARMIQSLLGPQ
jgi:hypothetical protein